MITRRHLLASAAPALVATPALAIALTPVAAPRAAPEAPASIEELRAYYGFLWTEFQLLAEELGVDRHDSWTFRQAGGRQAVTALTGDAPPSTRARAVMAAAHWRSVRICRGDG